MKLLTHNMLTSHVRGVRPGGGFPLLIKATEVKVNDIDFNPEFTARMVPKIEWGALVGAAESVSPRQLLGCGRRKAERTAIQCFLLPLGSWGFYTPCLAFSNMGIFFIFPSLPAAQAMCVEQLRELVGDSLNLQLKMTADLPSFSVGPPLRPSLRAHPRL
uniref:tRNA methyltransferase activator subunit 11-2 n=1 Tax=Laticauda laticaudata TaxID=8630 RepID=A0A8C5RJE4_LATLA